MENSNQNGKWNRGISTTKCLRFLEGKPGEASREAGLSPKRGAEAQSLRVCPKHQEKKTRKGEHLSHLRAGKVQVNGWRRLSKGGGMGKTEPETREKKRKTSKGRLT